MGLIPKGEAFSCKIGCMVGIRLGSDLLIPLTRGEFGDRNHLFQHVLGRPAHYQGLLPL